MSTHTAPISETATHDYYGYKPVIGLEIHAQLASKSKVYCSDAVDFGGKPNTRVSPITLAHPGTLPSFNQACLEMAIKIGLATNCEIAPHCYFARKNYFYADIPKGYQITQDQTPICKNGQIEIRLKNGLIKTIRIERIHIEEDSGKSYHDQDLYDSLIDFNRAGTGLIEIVSKPDIESPEEAMAYVTEIRKLVRYLDICDGNMEEGSLRCDVNVSIMKIDAEKFGTRVEVKNINSISNVGKAILYEIERQRNVLESGGVITQETRTWDAGAGATFSMRDKEDSSDYRYFPEPDLQPIAVTKELLQSIRSTLPELPEALFKKYVKEYGLPEHDAGLLTEQKEFAAYFEKVVHKHQNYRSASNWMNGSIKSYLNEQALDIKQFPIPPDRIAELIELIDSGKISNSIAKETIFPTLLQQPEQTALSIAEKANVLLNNNTEEIKQYIEQVLDSNADKVKTYLEGKTGLLGFFVGNVMKLTGGKADPKIINQLLTEALEARR